MPGIICVEVAQQQLKDGIKPVDTILVDLQNSLGMILSQNITSPVDIPLFENSQMDGFAVKSENVSGASPDRPISLRVIADIPAGTFPNFILQDGEAARIMTGAPLPQGADLVIPVEDTNQGNKLDRSAFAVDLQIFHAGRRGDFIRPRGQDIRQGQEVLPLGKRLRPQDVGLLATLGISRVPVYKLPRIAILSTGDELIPVDQPLQPGKIHDANSHLLRALLERFKVEVIQLGIVADDEDSVMNCLDRAVSERADIIISTAGVSVGAFDYVRVVLEKFGKVEFWRVNIRPGKPIAFGQYKGIPLIGLPGNPVSAYVGFEVFVSSALQKLSGMVGPSRREYDAKLAQPIESDGRESYLRCRIDQVNGEMIVRLTESHQGSGNIFSLVQASGLLIIPSGVKSLPAGSLVKVWLLDG